MKTMGMLSYLSLAALLLVSACGNPHVSMKSGKDRLRLPSITEPSLTGSDTLSPQLSSDENGKVSITTKLPEASKEIQIVNPNPDQDLVISYSIEKGDNFRLNPGDCETLLAAAKSCKPEVVFFSTTPGIYRDNLIVTYANKSKPDDSKNLIIPLIGERLADVIDPASIKPVELKDEDSKGTLAFSTDSTPVEKKVTATNPNEKEDLSVSYSLESGKFFEVKAGDCKEVLQKKSVCSPVVVFTATDPGVYKDNLIATYTSKSHPDLTKTVILPVIGEKLPKEVPVNPLLAPKVSGSTTLSTPEEEALIPLKVENVDPDDDLLVSYKLEKGSHFKLDSSDCSSSLESGKSCKPVVKFSAEKPRTYKDNLIITYSSKSNPSDTRSVVVPLTATKTAVIPTDISLDIIPNLGVNGIDFGKSLINQAITQMVVVRNPTDHEISLVSKAAKGLEFEIGKNGSCKKVIAPHSKCEIEVVFNSANVGSVASELTLTYASIYGGAEKKVSAKLLGEKVKDLNDCSGKPCGEPVKPAKLDFSSLNGQSLDFGQVSLNSKTKQTIPLFNTGDVPAEIESITISGEGYEMVSDCPKTLLPGFCNVEVVFGPKAEKHFDGVITVKTKDGQKVQVSVTGSGKQMLRCYKKTVHHVSAQPTYDISKVVLPYLNSSTQTTAKIYNLYGTKVNNLVKSLNRYTVKDSQVVTTFLIPALTGKVDQVEFTLDTSKVILDAHEDTESVCLSSSTIKKCSGKDFDTSFIKLKNPKFWSANKVPVNDLYEASLLKDQYKCGSYTCANMKKTFSANKLFELSDSELMSVLKDKVVSLVVTDDTRNMSFPSLLITTSEEIACKK